jgi:hypothetical protein
MKVIMKNIILKMIPNFKGMKGWDRYAIFLTVACVYVILKTLINYHEYKEEYQRLQGSPRIEATR